jgi:predicted CXXCH cytochrome family protein
MMRGPERSVCLGCHGDVRRAIDTARSFHPLEVGNGACSVCHTPHEASDEKLLRLPEAVLCSGCHESHAKFAHPMGPNVPDPRRPGRSLSCLSCHAPHASEFKAMLLAGPDRDLCVGCHAKLE